MRRRLAAQYGQDYIVNATLSVIDSSSVLFGEIVSGALVYYDIYNGTGDIIFSGYLDEYLGDLGTYKLDLNSSVISSIGIGNFT